MKLLLCSLINILWLTLVSSVSVAQPESGIRVTVEEFKGNRSEHIRKFVILALKKKGHKIQIVPKKEMETVVSRLNIYLDSEKEYAAVSRELNINAFIDGEVVREEKGWAVSVWIRQGDGKFIGQHSWRNRRFRRLSRIRNQFWVELGDSILRSQVAQKKEIEEEKDQYPEAGVQVPLSEKPEDDSSYKELEASRGSEELPAIEPELSFGLSWRNNGYSPEDVEQPYRYYNEFVSPTPWIDIHLKWFPGAHFTQEWPAHLGVVAGFGMGIGASSVYEDPVSDESEEPDTLTTRFIAGLIGRIPIHPLTLGLNIAYGRRTFKISSFEGLPDVAHSYLKTGIMADLSIVEDLGIDAELSYLIRLDSGELSSEDYFPELSGGGFQAGIGVYYLISKLFFVRLEFSMEYFYFDTGENDNYGELESGYDSYYHTALGVGLRY